MNFKREFLTRQMDLIPTEALGLNISVVGCGAVGSFTALALSKMGFLNLEVYDYDTISEENMNCQFYPYTDIGEKKSTALCKLIQAFTGATIGGHDEKVDKSVTLYSDIVISAVDSMAARKIIYQQSVCKYLIDPRMGAEYASMEVVDMSDPKDRENYEKTLYSDEETVHERCTAKSTMYTVLLLAGQICKAVKDIALKNKAYMRTMDWHIANNRISAFDGQGTLLN